jgi:hypothetical protein
MMLVELKKTQIDPKLEVLERCRLLFKEQRITELIPVVGKSSSPESKTELVSFARSSLSTSKLPTVKMSASKLPTLPKHEHH